jgi:hypothetical protein
MSGSGLVFCVLVVFGVYDTAFRIVLKEGHSLSMIETSEHEILCFHER